MQLDGQKFVGHNLHVAPDSTSWQDNLTGPTKTFPTKDVGEIVFTDSGRGARQGFLIGAASGFVVGYLLITSSGGDPCDGCNVYEFGLIYGGIGGAAGGVLGFFVGATSGGKDRYILNTSSALIQ